MPNSTRVLDTIIFGLKDYAELAYYYLKNDSMYRPVGFVLKGVKLPDNHGHCLPVMDWDYAIAVHPPKECNFFVPLSNNNYRAEMYSLAKDIGYRMPGYISSKAIVNGSVGDNCFIQELNNIQPFARVGNNCVLWAGNHIGHHSVIEDDVTITSHCVISGHCRIKQGAFLGVNCTIRDGITVGRGSVIGAGANVTKDVPDGVTVVGNPARAWGASGL